MRNKHIQHGKTIAALLLTAWLAACGSGGDDDTPNPVPPAPSAQTVLRGTVAIGAALVNAEVTVRDRSGASACTNDPVKTDATGAYRCVLSVASLAPFAVLAVDPEGLINPMISVVGSKPGPGAESTANVTPLTTAIAAQLNNDPFAFFTNSALLGSLDVATLNSVKANVVTQIAAVLRDAGVNPATFDPVTSPFVGGSGTGADKMLDQIRITFDNGSPTISNVLNPAAAVPLAGASSSGGPTVAAATVRGFSLSELDFAKTQLERCFAVPSSTRTINPDTTNFRLGNLAPECEDFLAKVGPNIDISFKHSGQLAEVFFYSLLTSSDMDGAKFNLPELMRYATESGNRDEALLNIKYRDKNGVPGNLILTAKKFPGSRPSPSGATQWWLVGNQRSINAFIRTAVRQREQLIPQTALDTPSFFNAARSRLETGLEIFIQRPNNGTTVNWVNNPNNAVRYVRVKGPGLPTDGLVFGDVDQNVPQNWLGILNATGANPNDSSTTQQRAITTSNIFRIQRTEGISGSAGFTLRPNPGVSSAIASPSTGTSVSWAHPNMYGVAASVGWQFNLSNVPAWSIYNFEVFCGIETTACETFSSSITTPLMPAPFAATQQWHSFTASSRSFVTNGALVASSAEIAWTPNTLAERIGSVNAYSFGAAGPVNSFSTLVPKGTFSRTVDAVGGQFPAISTSDNTRGRTLQIRHVMLDGSYKDHLIQFN
jgi:hypothetical protein